SPGGAELTVRSVASGESFTIPLPAAKWTAIFTGQNQTYKYRDTTGSTCKIAILKFVAIVNGPRLIKAVCKGTQVSYTLGADQVSVDVVLRSGTAPRRWCTAFNGTTAGCSVVRNGSDGKKYLAKNCGTAPAVCGASPSGAFLDIGSLF